MYRALVIDDERPARQAIIALGNWEKHGILPPQEAQDSITALAMMEKIKPDIVFVDMYMPILDGLGFLQRAAPSNPDTKFIVISGFDDYEYLRQSFRYGVIEYLLKPIVAVELEQALSQAVTELNALKEKNKKSARKTSDIEKHNESRNSTAEMMAEIKIFIENNYSKDINLIMFSEKFYVTKEYLSRCFKDTVGLGIYEYLTTTRMKKAEELIRLTDGKIRTIAQIVGYSDQNYFSRAFKNYYGVHPTEYRMGAIKSREGKI